MCIKRAPLAGRSNRAAKCERLGQLVARYAPLGVKPRNTLYIYIYIYCRPSPSPNVNVCLKFRLKWVKWVKFRLKWVKWGPL